MSTFFKSLLVEEDGATMVEYALMVALIGAALVTAVTGLKSAISTQLGNVATAVSGGS